MPAHARVLAVNAMHLRLPLADRGPSPSIMNVVP